MKSTANMRHLKIDNILIKKSWRSQVSFKPLTVHVKCYCTTAHHLASWNGAFMLVVKILITQQIRGKLSVAPHWMELWKVFLGKVHLGCHDTIFFTVLITLYLTNLWSNGRDKVFIWTVFCLQEQSWITTCDHCSQHYHKTSRKIP